MAHRGPAPVSAGRIIRPSAAPPQAPATEPVARSWRRRRAGEGSPPARRRLIALVRAGVAAQLLAVVCGFVGADYSDWGNAMAFASVFVTPVIIVFVLLQRRIVSGLTAGALK